VSGNNSGKRSGEILGNMLRYGSGSDSGEALGIVSDKGPGKCPGKNSCKEAGQDKTCKTGRFLCFGVNPS
jgi:hypothetical protein